MNELKNIINLSKIFILENNNDNYIIDKKLNKKNPIIWLAIILFFGISYASYQVIHILIGMGKPEVFLNGYFLFLQILIFIQAIMLCTNVLFFSKDIENVLPLPFKPIEILLSKFNVLVFMAYTTELIFALIPFSIYGIYANMGVLFFIKLIVTLIIFPIFSIIIVCIVEMFLIRIIKMVKNKDLMQLIMSSILIFIFLIIVGIAMKYTFDSIDAIQKTEEAKETLNNINENILGFNKYFIILNPITNFLQDKNIIKIFLDFFEIIIINFIAFFIFIFLGEKIYFKQLLKNKFYKENKKNKKIKFKKKNKIIIAYLKKEIKLLKNPLLLLQSIYPVIMITITTAVLLIAIIPQAIELFQTEQFKEQFENLKFDFEAMCLILGLIQVITLFNYTSITCFSREGKNVFVIKYLPVSLYKQYVYKNIPQIFINIISAIIILGVLKYEIPAIEMKYILVMFILSILLIIINSFILSFIDLINPKINWDSEYEILKNSKNKLFQYVLIIFNIFFLYYMNDIFKEHNLDKSIIAFLIILIVILISMNLFIYKFKNKLFKKIN